MLQKTQTLAAAGLQRGPHHTSGPEGQTALTFPETIKQLMYVEFDLS